MFLAFNGDATLLQFYQLFYDGQAQSRSAVFPRYTCIGLAKAFKYGCQFFVGYSNAGIDHFNSYPTNSLHFTIGGTVYLNRTVVCKLYRVAYQIYQNLI